ncbi:MAG TPA: hypothetical protein VE553_06020 [Candidatus Binatia bacterium]|nr:hypothetical protein [Candidatus Binatia bacterium]
MNAFEELTRKLTMIEARLASYERLHTEELSELKSMLQALKMQQVAIQSQAAHEAALHLDGNESVSVEHAESDEGEQPGKRR